MEGKAEVSKLLDMMIQPGFSVRENIIIQVNQAARTLLLEPGCDVRELLATGREEFAAFSQGCLYVQLSLWGRLCGAAVLRMDDLEVFLLDPEPENSQFHALALAAQGLRGPMSTVMLAADQITAAAAQSEDPQALTRTGRLNRGLDQLMRVINNMSDALLYSELSKQETRNVAVLFDEVFEKAQTLLAQAGRTLTYEGLREDVFALADDQQLERAVLNMLSNAVKFTPAGSPLRAKLSRRGNTLSLSVEDDGPGIRDDILANIFHRYLRRPGIEDSRFGLGLGLVLVRSVAANHGGVVLIDQPKGARITMTIALRRDSGTALRSACYRVDYAGGHDHALIELSDVLPAELYERK